MPKPVLRLSARAASISGLVPALALLPLACGHPIDDEVEDVESMERDTISYRDADESPVDDADDESPVDDVDEPDNGYVDDWGNLEVHGGEIKGDFGPMSGVSSNANVMGYGEPGYSWVEVMVDDTGEGSVMHGIDVYGGLDHSALVPGAHFEFDEATSDPWGGELYVMVWTCSGQAPYDWDYDHTSQQSTIDISATDDPDVVRVSYTATVTEDDDVTGQNFSQGSFLLHR